MAFNSLIEILMVEDDPGDVDLTRETLEDSKIRVSLNVVADGVMALEYLYQKGQFANAAKPDMILLDLNLPKKDGREVLAKIKSDPNLRSIPIIVLTTSDADEDIIKTYDLGANCYITKPVGLEQFSKVVKSIENFWFTIVKMPPK